MSGSHHSTTTTASLPRGAAWPVEGETEKRAKLCRVLSENVSGLTESDGGHPYISNAVAGCYHRINGTRGWYSQPLDCCRNAGRLRPAMVDGGENCIESALGFGLWGLSSEIPVIHRILYVAILEFGELCYRERWRRQCQILDFLVESSSWFEVVLSAVGRSNHMECTSWSSAHLKEGIQVFIFANVLRRPIIVLSDCEHIRGVYLPLLFDSTLCIKHPLVLAYEHDRFIPLVGTACELDMNRVFDLIPLVTPELEPLRVWFLLEEEENIVNDLVSRYMVLTEKPMLSMQNISTLVPVAQLEFKELDLNIASTGRVESAVGEAGVYTHSVFHLDPTPLHPSIQSSNEHIRSESAQTQRNIEFTTNEVVSELPLYERTIAEIEERTRKVAARCKNDACVNFGNSKSKGYCHDCFQSMGTYLT